MRDFINFPCFTGFLGKSCTDPIPPEPGVPTPADRVIEDPDGLDNYETVFNTVVPGGVVIGIAGKNNASIPVNFSVTVDNNPVEVLVFTSGNGANASFSYIAAVVNLAIGSHTIKVTPIGASSSGTAALRIIETDPMPVDWKGSAKGFSGAGTATGVAVRLENTTIGSTVISIAAWNDKRAYRPYCETYRVPRVRQQTVRDDLIRDTVAVGFFRSTVEGNDIYLAFKSFLSAGNYTTAMAELRGVTLRP